MENFEQSILDNNLVPSQLVISEHDRIYLLETAKWGKFLSIVGFVITGLIIIAAIFIGSVFAFMGKITGNGFASSQMNGAASGAITFIYVIIGVFYFFPTYYLFQFSTKIKLAIKNKDQENLSFALLKQKSLFKFMGITTAVLVSIYGLMFIIFSLIFAAR